METCGVGGGGVPQLSIHNTVTGKFTDTGVEVVLAAAIFKLVLTVNGDGIVVTTGVLMVAVSSIEVQLLCLPDICVFKSKTSLREPEFAKPMPTT